MATLSIGPGLAAFPAFPDPGTVDPFSLNFQATATTLSFELAGYDFDFTGDFTEAAAALQFIVDPPGIPAFYLALAGFFPVDIRLDGVTVTRQADGAKVIGYTGQSADLTLPFFFGTLTDPANYTDDILTKFFGSTAAFTTFDLSAFDNAVVLGRANAGVHGPDGERGVVSYTQETDGFAFTTVLGGDGDDRIGGSGVSDSLAGGVGDDLLLGRDGGDTLSGGDGDDVVDGGAGDDLLAGGFGRDVLAGRAGANTLLGGEGADVFVIARGPGRDLVADLGTGDRVDVSAFGLSARELAKAIAAAEVTAEGLSMVIGGRSLVFAGLDEATDLSASMFVRKAAPVGAAAEVRAGGPASGALFGQAGDDVLVGGERGQLLRGGAGDDVAIAGGGRDRLFGDGGDDALDGGAGDDTIRGGAGADVLFGDDGDDRLRGGSGDDFLDGGAGDDTIEGGTGGNCLTGATGADVFVFLGFDGATDRVTDFETGVDRIDIRALVDGTLTAENLDEFIAITSPGATFLTRFLLVDRDGAGGEFGFEEVAQFDNLDDADLRDSGNYLL